MASIAARRLASASLDNPHISGSLSRSSAVPGKWQTSGLWRPRPGTGGDPSPVQGTASGRIPVDAGSTSLFAAFAQTGDGRSLWYHLQKPQQTSKSSSIDWRDHKSKQYFFNPDDGSKKTVSWREQPQESADGKESYIHRVTTQPSTKASRKKATNISSYLDETTYDDLTQTALSSLTPEQRAVYDERARNGMLPSNVRVELVLTRHMQSEENANTALFKEKLGEMEKSFKKLEDDGQTDGLETKAKAAAHELKEEYPTPIDSHLTQWGLLGAKDLHEQIKQYPKPDLVWSSCMTRARETCQEIYGGMDVPKIISDLPRERFGPGIQETKSTTLHPHKDSSGYKTSGDATTRAGTQIAGDEWLNLYDRQDRLKKMDDGSLLYTDPFSNADGSKSLREGTAVSKRLAKCLDSISAMARVYAAIKPIDASQPSGDPVHVKIAAVGHGGMCKDLKKRIGCDDTAMANGQTDTLILDLETNDSGTSLIPRYSGNRILPRYHHDRYNDNSLMPSGWNGHLRLENRWNKQRARSRKLYEGGTTVVSGGGTGNPSRKDGSAVGTDAATTDRNTRLGATDRSIPVVHT